MPRYEFSEGTSNKFWEINLSGTSFTTTYGKIGASGATTIKTFGSDADAKKEHDKLVAEKVKKGYTLIGGAKPKAAKAAVAPKIAKATPAPKAKAGKAEAAPAKAAPGKAKKAEAKPGGNAELEAAITADPTDTNAYSVYADWLEEQGDPRGQLIALQLANKAKPAAALIEKEAAHFLGDLAAHQKTRDGNNKDAFTWKYGFIHGANLSYNANMEAGVDVKLVDVLAQLLAHPSGRFLVELTVTFNGDMDDNLQDIINLIAKRGLPTLRKLHLGDFVHPDENEMSWFHVGNLTKLWKAVPNLRHLIVQGGDYELGPLDLPNLEHAEFRTGGLIRVNAKEIGKAKWPKLKHLDVWFGQKEYGGTTTVAEAKQIFDRSDLKALKHLGLMNAEFMTDLVRLLPTAKLLPQLEELSLAMGTMTDSDAAELAPHKDAFAHLKLFDVSENCLESGAKLLKGFGKKVETKGQRDNDPEYRHSAVGE